MVKGGGKMINRARLEAVRGSFDIGMDTDECTSFVAIVDPRDLNAPFLAQFRGSYGKSGDH